MWARSRRNSTAHPGALPKGNGNSDPDTTCPPYGGCQPRLPPRQRLTLLSFQPPGAPPGMTPESVIRAEGPEVPGDCIWPGRPRAPRCWHTGLDTGIFTAVSCKEERVGCADAALPRGHRVRVSCPCGAAFAVVTAMRPLSVVVGPGLSERFLFPIPYYIILAPREGATSWNCLLRLLL